MSLIKTIVHILLLLTTSYCLAYFYSERKRVKAPRLGKNPWFVGLWHARREFTRNGKNLTKKGYDLYKDSMYWIQTGDTERLVISNKFIDELRRLSDDYLDSKIAVVERNLGWYNRVDIILKSTAHVDVCRHQLVQNLARVTDNQVADIGRIFGAELFACTQDKEFHFYRATECFLNIVNRLTAKTLVGESLCEDPKWLKTTLETTKNTGILCNTLKPYPSFFRPFISPFTSAYRELNSSYSEAQDLLRGVINNRKQGDDNVDILQWLLDSHKDRRFEAPFITNQTLFVAIASIRSTATSLVNIVFDLLSYPEHIEPLRHDINEALRRCGGWNLAAIQDMKRLDSFVKESQRMNHHILLSFNRKVRRTIKLSDGTTLPPGTFISMPAYWSARDSSLFPSADEFRPWRWFELRRLAEEKNKSVTKFLASSTSRDNLHWGYGRNACPGRFMATAEIKLILAWILHHFDMVLPDRNTTRPDTLFFDERALPDPSQEVGFRSRTVNTNI